MRQGGRVFLLFGILLVVGALLLGAYLFFLPPQAPQGADLNAVPPTSTPIPLKRIVVAKIEITANTILTDTETYLRIREIPETEYDPEKNFTSLNELRDKEVNRTIPPEAPILVEDVVDPGLSRRIPQPSPEAPALKAFPLMVNSMVGVANQVQENDYVDIIMSFRIQRKIIRPSLETDPETGEPRITFKEEDFTGRTTKTLVQNVQVLQIVRPPPPTPDGSEPVATRPPPGPPATDDTGQVIVVPTPEPTVAAITPGEWVLILAVTNQQAEIIRLSLDIARDSQDSVTDGGQPLTVVLRGRGDSTVQESLGATLELLVSEFGLPLPGSAPAETIPESELTPVPTPFP